MSSPSANKQGFTLLEVLISIVLLVVISLAIYQATTSTYRLRDSLLNEGDFNNAIRLAMQLIDRDVAQMYTPALQLPAPQPTPSGMPTQQEMQSPAEEAQPTQFWGGYLDKSGARAMRFVGTENRLSFVAASNLRIHRDAPESEFLKVVYELQDDPERGDGIEGKVLVKTASPNAFSEDDSKDRLRHTYRLVRGVRKLRFRYWRKDKDNGWSSSWDSDAPDTKDIYPDLIEATVEVAGPGRLTYEGVYKFRPEIPLRGLDPST